MAGAAKRVLEYLGLVQEEPIPSKTEAHWPLALVLALTCLYIWWNLGQQQTIAKRHHEVSTNSPVFCSLPVASVTQFCTAFLSADHRWKQKKKDFKISCKNHVTGKKSLNSTDHNCQQHRLNTAGTGHQHHRHHCPHHHKHHHHHNNRGNRRTTVPKSTGAKDVALAICHDPETLSGATSRPAERHCLTCHALASMPAVPPTQDVRSINTSQSIPLPRHCSQHSQGNWKNSMQISVNSFRNSDPRLTAFTTRHALWAQNSRNKDTMPVESGCPLSPNCLSRQHQSVPYSQQEGTETGECNTEHSLLSDKHSVNRLSGRKINRSLQACSKASKSLQAGSKVSKSLQAGSKVNRSLQADSQVNRSLKADSQIKIPESSVSSTDHQMVQNLCHEILSQPNPLALYHSAREFLSKYYVKRSRHIQASQAFGQASFALLNFSPLPQTTALPSIDKSRSILKTRAEHKRVAEYVRAFESLGQVKKEQHYGTEQCAVAEQGKSFNWEHCSDIPSGNNTRTSQTATPFHPTEACNQTQAGGGDNELSELMETKQWLTDLTQQQLNPAKIDSCPRLDNTAMDRSRVEDMSQPKYILDNLTAIKQCLLRLEALFFTNVEPAHDVMTGCQSMKRTARGPL